MTSQWCDICVLLVRIVLSEMRDNGRLAKRETKQAPSKRPIKLIKSGSTKLIFGCHAIVHITTFFGFVHCLIFKFQSAFFVFPPCICRKDSPCRLKLSQLFQLFIF
ncbi:hypothetical protein CHARACLAT_024731 [Characodon lateralis]|uniref:Uncharacterized protein n=1 Tax=Characodon lateralis TaxID=208331 RepID=A0ABU7F6S5_9TELE|nr:hypothetical protein [Characodon lateralis]